MNLLTYLSLALTLVTSTTAASLDIKTTHSTDCTRRTQRGDTIHMHYRGTLASTQQEFDSSYKRGEPLVIPIGVGIVIRGRVFFYLPVFGCVGQLGVHTYVVLKLDVLTIYDCRWDEGLLNMCIGDKRTLTIPPEYGYGDRSIGPIPGGSTLVFETELVGVDGVEKKDEL